MAIKKDRKDVCVNYNIHKNGSGVRSQWPKSNQCVLESKSIFITNEKEVDDENEEIP